MVAKIHTGENELEFNLQKTTARFHETVKINGKGFQDNIKILLKEYDRSPHWKNEAPKVPSIHPFIHPPTPFVAQKLCIYPLVET